MLEAYFALSGRIRRWRYLFYSVLLWFGVLLLALLSIPLVDIARHPKAASILLIVVIGLFWLWAGMALVAKRLHDLDRTAWHYVWMFLLPALLTGGWSFHWSGSVDARWSVSFGYATGIVPLLATLYLIFARGTDGPNRYGYPPEAH